MKYPASNPSRSRLGHRARKAFTFIELVVAIALSVVLLRGMYAIFHSATTLAVLSEQRIVNMLEMAAVFDYISDDVIRSRPVTDDYYLDIGDDRKSVRFQMLRADGAYGKYVYVRYHLDGSDLKRAVYGNDNAAVLATEAVDGEDGVEIVIARHVDTFQVYYFDASEDDIDDDGTDNAWTLPVAGAGDLVDGERTMALKFRITIDNPKTNDAHLHEQDFTLTLPVMY